MFELEGRLGMKVYLLMLDQSTGAGSDWEKERVVGVYDSAELAESDIEPQRSQYHPNYRPDADRYYVEGWDLTTG